MARWISGNLWIVGIVILAGGCGFTGYGTIGAARFEDSVAAGELGDEIIDEIEPIPTILAGDHLGYKNQHCDQCHTLPVANHTVSDPSVCAECHGGNGACNPNGAGVTRAHAVTDACVGCHSTSHSYAADTECSSCHFAAEGTVDCAAPADDPPVDDPPIDDPPIDDPPPGGGPLLSANLVVNCFNWPAQDFAAGNSARTSTALRVGETAVEFTLDDLQGNSHTLSDMLSTKPVVLLFGAFT